MERYEWLIRGRPAENGDFSFIRANREDAWRTRQAPHHKWVVGDRVFFWASSPWRALIGVGEFLGEKGEDPDEGTIYQVRYLADKVAHPIPLARLRAEVALQDAIFLKNGPATSVVRLTQVEGRHLYQLLMAYNPELGDVWVDRDAPHATLDDLEASAIEGDRRLRYHLRVERSHRLVQDKKKMVLAELGCLACEACGFDFEAYYGALGRSYCEVHHRLPLSRATAPQQTTLSDLAIVCANCHRILHRGEGLTVEALKAELRRHTKGD